MKNIMSVDLEDYFCDLPIQEWQKYESRIEQTTDIILELFQKYNVKATFFTLGYIAEKFPNLIKKIHDEGHELGSHTYSHMDLRKVSKEEFEKDLVKSITIIEKTSGQKVLGFRAPFFSINYDNFWVFDVLRKYFKYDSSIFPVKSTLYGLPKAPRTIYHPSIDNPLKEDESQSFIEIPLLTYRIFSMYNLPAARGFYIKFLPNFVIEKGIKKFNEQNNPAMIYIHPKDLDENMPKISEYAWYYYYGKKNVNNKFRTLLKKFKFNTAKKILNLT